MCAATYHYSKVNVYRCWLPVEALAGAQGMCGMLPHTLQAMQCDNVTVFKILVYGCHRIYVVRWVPGHCADLLV
jgi:hypothetical protein